MHDYFQILGVAPDAARRDIRDACARHAARPHADLLEAEHRRGAGAAGVRDGFSIALADVAIDFPSMSAVVDRMQAAFFSSPSHTPRSREP